MKLIQNNPYRIIGVLSNVSERDLQKQKSKYTKFASIGKQIESDFDFPFLTKIIRTETSVNIAFSSIEQNIDKVNNSLFWFSMVNSFDGAALNHLSNGNKSKAIEIWEKVTREKEVSNKNFSCFNNLSTLLLIGISLVEKKIGLELKIKLIESQSFDDFVDSVADKQTFGSNSERQIQHFIDVVITELVEKYSIIEVVGLFNNCSVTIQKYVSQKLTKDPIHRIETNIENTKKKREKTSNNSVEIGLKLYSSCIGDLETLKIILGSNDLNYKMISDKTAKEIMQCGIDFFVDNGQEETLIDKTVSVLEKAKLISVGQTMKDRVEENISELKEIKFAEIVFIISVLKSIKLAITDLEEQNKSKSRFEKQVINKEKVDEILRKEITLTRILKLINSKNKTYIDEFTSLARFIRDELFSAGIIRVIELLVNNLPEFHSFVISEKERKRKIEEDIKKRKADEEARRKREAEKAEERKKRDAEIEAERRRKEKEENEQFILKLIGVIAVILIVAGAIWGWDGVIGVIVIGVLLIIGGSSR